MTATEPRRSRLLTPTVRLRTRRFIRNRTAAGGAAFLCVVGVLTAFPELFAPYSASTQSLSHVFAPPSAQHWLGTDELGRDALSRLIFGTRTSIVAGVVASGVAVLSGVPLGMAAAYWRRFGKALDRINDALMSIPALLLAITVVTVGGPGLLTSTLGIGVAFIPRFFRLARASTRQLLHEPFVEASRAVGCSGARVLWFHVLPNSLTPLIVQGALTFGTAIVAEAGLSFLGLGVPPPTPSWGNMLENAAGSLYQGSYLVWGPAALMTLTVLASQFVADGLQDALGGGLLEAGTPRQF